MLLSTSGISLILAASTLDMVQLLVLAQTTGGQHRIPFGQGLFDSGHRRLKGGFVLVIKTCVESSECADVGDSLTHLTRSQHCNVGTWDHLGVLLPHIPDYCSQTFHLFYLIFPSVSIRNSFIKFMASKNIVAASHYQPLHSSGFMLKSRDDWYDTCPVTTRISGCLARLPLFSDMSEEQLEHVLRCVREFEF